MRKILLLALAVALIFGLAGCSLFRYHLAWETAGLKMSTREITVGTRATGRAFEVREVYYSEDPLALSFYRGVAVLMENDLGIEPTGPVEWHISDASIGELVDSWGIPSRRDFQPAATGIQEVRQAVVSATFEGETATSRIVVFPCIKFINGTGVDLDGDGINDIETIAGSEWVKFPFGMRALSDQLVFPVNLGELSLDTEAPPVEEVVYKDAISHWWLVVFNTSSGRKFAGIISGGAPHYAILWRPLDVAY